jgi:hypothetical protein
VFHWFFLGPLVGVVVRSSRLLLVARTFR